MKIPKRQNFSRKREAILQAICNTKIHPTAEWVYQKLKPDYPDLSLGTVYRNITRFKEEGLVVSVGVVNGQERLDGTVTPHTHFVCQVCGSVLDLEESFLPKDVNEKVEKAYGVNVASRDLVFHGTCKDCITKH